MSMGALIIFFVFSGLIFIALLFATYKIIHHRHEVSLALSCLMNRLKASEEERREELTALFSSVLSDEKEVEAIVSKTLEKEKTFYQGIIDIFLKREYDQIGYLDKATESLLSPYHKLLNKAVSPSIKENASSLQKAQTAEKEAKMAAKKIFNEYIKMTKGKALLSVDLSVREMMEKIHAYPLTDMLPEDIKRRYDEQFYEIEKQQHRTLLTLGRLFTEYLKLFHLVAPQEEHFSLEVMDFFIEKGRFPESGELDRNEQTEHKAEATGNDEDTARGETELADVALDGVANDNQDESVTQAEAPNEEDDDGKETEEHNNAEAAPDQSNDEDGENNTASDKA